jgi:uncharacterized protein YndB with AHSA1/START domain
MGNTLQQVHNDLKEGGTVKYVFNDETIVISGKYEQVQPNKKLVYSWDWQLKEDALRNASYKLTVEFKGVESKSSLHILQENFENEEVMQPHREGWDQGLADLQRYLQGKGSASTETSAEDAGASAGYGESPDQQKVGGG